MKSFGQFVRSPLLVWLVLAQGCALISDDMPKKSAPVGLIATPPSYYSTLKARYLGQKYQENVTRLVEKIVRNPKTANLQFANNIASVGGIGFFTHSAAKVPDERYLEVVLVAPETFERKGDYSAKVHRLFSLYGSELLAILSSDVDIYREPEVAGYGLNLSWRTITSDASGPNVALERAVTYFPKEEVRRFLNKEVVENNFLRDAVIFAAEAEGPMNLVSYRQQERKPDFRPPIQEEILAAGRVKPFGETKAPEVAAPQPRTKTEVEKHVEASALVDKSSAAKPEVPPVTKREEDGTKRLPASAKNSGVTAPSPSAQSAMREPQASPDKNAVQEPILEKPSAPAIGTSTPAETKSGLPTRPFEMPEEKTAAAPSPAGERLGEPKATKTQLQPPATGETKGAAAGQTTTKPRQETKGLSMALSKAPSIPEPAGNAHVIETRESTPAAEDKFAKRDLPIQTGSTASPNTSPPLAEKVDAPLALSKAEVKVTEEISQLPPPAAPPKGVPSGSPSLKPSRQARASERQSSPQTSNKEETSKAVTQPRMEANPVASLGSNRAAPVVQAEEVKKPKLEKSVEPEIAAPSGAKMAAPSPSIEAQAALKRKVAAPAPVVEAKVPIAEKNLSLPAAPMDPPAKQTVTKPVPVKQELALLTNKPTNKPAEVKSSVRAAPKTLKGYIIQVAFTDKDMAQQWAERLEGRGYAVSVTKAGNSGSIRLRIGNFPGRQEAERELRSLGKDGLSGIVLNLPDGFRPAESAPVAARTAGGVPAAQ